MSDPNCTENEAVCVAALLDDGILDDCHEEDYYECDYCIQEKVSE